MSDNELNLTPEQSRLLGQVYAFIIQRAREKQAIQTQSETVHKLCHKNRSGNSTTTTGQTSGNKEAGIKKEL